MEGKEKLSVSNWRKIQKEKREMPAKKEFYRKNQEKLAEKARERE